MVSISETLNSRMILFRVALATLAVASFVEGGVVSPLHKGSNGDQYERRWGGGSVPQVEMERFHDEDATDRKHVPTKDSEESPRRHSSSVVFPQLQEKHQRESANYLEHNRNKRSYYPYAQYNYQIPQFQSLNAWKPAVYPLQRPYYIPVFGIEGRIPIYIPQQPFYLNPGTPPHNPGKPPYVGPTYLPPTYLPPVTSSPPTNGTTMKTVNRFNGDDDDRPIWDNGDDQSVVSTTEASIKPTRKPAQAGPKTFPPLVHKDGSDASSNNLSPAEVDRPTTESTIRQPPGPSRCVWAIVSCCSTASKVASMSCFEQFGCAGPFWDVSPCETEYARAAINSALNYYNSQS